jgi:hypothetical protein
LPKKVNNNLTWDAGIDKASVFGVSDDTAIVGDWTGDGIAKIGTYRGSTSLWALDVNNNLAWDSGTDKSGVFGAPGDLWVVGDWDGSGIARARHLPSERRSVGTGLERQLGVGCRHRPVRRFRRGARYTGRWQVALAGRGTRFVLKHAALTHIIGHVGRGSISVRKLPDCRPTRSCW